MAEYDLVIKGGSRCDHRRCLDDGCRGPRRRSPPSVGTFQAHATIDAAGKLVLPGGVDAHCHIEQISGGGLMNADTFETATRSAAFGGTTTVISFAAQHRGDRLA